VESRRRKTVWKSWDTPRPLLLRILQRLQARRPARVQLFEKSKGMLQIGKFIHQVDLRQKGVPHVSELRSLPQPGGKFLASRRCNLIYDASGTAFGSGAAGTQQSLLLQAFQVRIDLAQLGGPEMSDAMVQDSLQVVTAGRLTKET
jgi:hypothetical protein